MKLKIFALLPLFGLVLGASMAQKSPADSLKNLLSQNLPDTSRSLILDQIGRAYMYSKPVEAMYYAEQGLNLARKIHFDKGISRNLNRIGAINRIIGNFPKALESFLFALKIAKDNNDTEGVAKIYNNIGILYSEQKDSKTAIAYFLKTKNLAEKLHDDYLLQIVLTNIGVDYKLLNKLDSALIYTQLAYAMESRKKSDNVNILLLNMGEIYFLKEAYSSALAQYKRSVPFSKALSDDVILSQTYVEMAKVYQKTNQLDSCLLYAKKSLEIAMKVNNPKNIYDTGRFLSAFYDKSEPSKAYYYFKLATAAKDSLYSMEKVQSLQKMAYEERELEAKNRRRIEARQTAFVSQVKIYSLAILLLGFAVFAFFLYRNNRQKNRANTLLHLQKQEIDIQRNKAEKALEELKATQAQLIQKEKLASLGELTAGIAHEIQNPLNFVNNFSELSIELLDELAPQPPEGGINTPPLGVGGLLSDIKLNLQKINLHGKRASSIVKGMLEHSRTSTGERELTDINQLADEYLRLSYHDMRAKNKDGSTIRFNADFEFIPDPNLPKVMVVPQDIGRVLLNLINNAFYAVSHRVVVVETLHETSLQQQQSTSLQQSKYQPSVRVSTHHIDNQLIISVKDNGNGIPADILPKIFQPFFTTKPTGEGTGLGLSLSYDVITKGYGGTMEVISKEGEGAEFIIKLPIG